LLADKEFLRELVEEYVTKVLPILARQESLVKGPNCLSIPQMEDYVKHRYTQEEFSKIFHHVTSCHYCRRMVIKMRDALEEKDAE
jgi:hypothetical protein